jgi:hypothetical protein
MPLASGWRKREAQAKKAIPEERGPIGKVVCEGLKAKQGKWLQIHFRLEGRNGVLKNLTG